ncbi:MAG: hypothetical protein GY758_01355 [Fuerstiella sp.]|nr:hypothetical protein [Fuerstiella sp.]MCP4512294.1 hypothetical protein [Fuerstiella sp.]MDG2129854.1 hypothetical protein [Fuerstiella sp.]
MDEAIRISTEGVHHGIRRISGGDVIPAAANIGSVRDLKKSGIGVESTAVGFYVLVRALQQSQPEVTDVTVGPLQAE